MFHSYKGFFARPETKADGSVNLMHWKCMIPGKKDTIWEGGYYPLTLDFPEDYPQRPPKVRDPFRFSSSLFSSSRQLD